MSENTTTYKKDIVSNPCNYCLHKDVCKAKSNLEAIRGSIMETNINEVKVRNMEGFRLLLQCDHYYPKYKKRTEKESSNPQ